MKSPFILQWHITHRCNLRCRHCYQDDYAAFSDRAALSCVLDQYTTLLQACDFRGHLNVTGGEPLLHPDLFWLLHEAAERGITTAVLTNGTLIGRQEARAFKAAGVQYVQVSLDGMEKTHDAIRGEGSFAQAAEGIFALRAQGIFTSVSFTAGRQNRRELGRLARYCRLVGADMLWFDRVVIPAEKDREGQSLSAREYQRLTKQAAHLNRRGMVSCARSLQFLPCRDSDKRIYHCTAGESLLAVLADGSVMPCRRLPITVGSLLVSDLLTIYRDSLVLRQMRESPVPGDCRACRYAEACRGGARCIAYAKTGRWDVRDSDCLCPS